jgi:hypothetical protein
VECGIDVRITLQTVPSSSSFDNYYHWRTQPRVESYPNFLDTPKHKLLAYL